MAERDYWFAREKPRSSNGFRVNPCRPIGWVIFAYFFVGLFLGQSGLLGMHDLLPDWLSWCFIASSVVPVVYGLVFKTDYSKNYEE